MIPPGALNLLGVLDFDQPQTVTELADRTDHSRKHTYEILDWLSDHDLTRETRGPKNRREVTLRNTPLTTSYQTLTTIHSHVNWSEILTPARIRVIWYLDQPRSAAKIADALDISTPRVHTILKPLKERAMLDPAGPTYALASNLRAPLHEFTTDLITHIHAHTIHQLAPHATLSWASPTAALLRSTRPEETDRLTDADDYHLTGLAAFADYDLPFYLSTEPAFWYAQTPATPSERICHLLTLDDSPRRTGYAMLLIEHLDIHADDLRETAANYDLTDHIDNIYTALTDTYPESSDMLPSEKEYTQLKSQYGVV